MPRSHIHFFSEDIQFNLKYKTILRKWIYDTIHAEGYILEKLNFVFCSDSYLLSLNQDYLHHDTYTDIITFDNSENNHRIVGDIFISIDRVRENALSFNVPPENELYRVMVHGILHLMGYKDKRKKEKTLMTAKEDNYLNKLSLSLKLTPLALQL